MYVPEHPRNFCGGYVFEHRLVIERDFGAVLPDGTTVHHITEVKDDNCPTNLFACVESEHRRAHG